MAAASSMSSKPMTERSPGTVEPGARGRVEHAEGLHVGGREDGRGPPAQRQQLARERERGLAAVRAAPDVARRQRDAGLAQHRGACPPGAAGWRRRRTGCSRRRRRRRCRGGRPRAGGAAASAPPATSSMATLGSSACATSTSTVGTPSRCSARTSAGVERQRDDDHPVDAVAAREAPQRGAALVERLDVEERQVVGAAPDDVVDPAQALDHGRAGEEGGDDAERLGAPERQVARGRARAIAELLHDRADAHAGGMSHPGRIVEHTRNRADAHAGALGDVANPRRTRARAFRSAGHDAKRYPRTRRGDAAAVRPGTGARAPMLSRGWPASNCAPSSTAS